MSRNVAQLVARWKSGVGCLTPDFCAVAAPDPCLVLPRHPSHIREFGSERDVLGAAVADAVVMV